jgi:hypothetical protein
VSTSNATSSCSIGAVSPGPKRPVLLM